MVSKKRERQYSLVTIKHVPGMQIVSTDELYKIHSAYAVRHTGGYKQLKAIKDEFGNDLEFLYNENREQTDKLVRELLEKMKNRPSQHPRLPRLMR